MGSLIHHICKGIDHKRSRALKNKKTHVTVMNKQSSPPIAHRKTLKRADPGEGL